MKKVISNILLLLALTFMSQCEKFDNLDKYKDPNIELTATMPLNGEYYVRIDSFIESSSQWFVDYDSTGYRKIKIFNTAANIKDSVWLSDASNLELSCRIGCNPSDKTFNKGECFYPYVESIVSEADTAIFHVVNPYNYKITPGKEANTFVVSGNAKICKVFGGILLQNAVLMPSNVLTDSINIEMDLFDNNNTSIGRYRYAGYRITGFLEDEP